MPRRARALSLRAGLTVAGALLPTAPAWSAELHARGPAACPDASELVFRLERTLGAPLVRDAPLSFRVVFEPPAAASARYTARLSVRDESGASSERVLSALDCDGLGDAVAVAIALAIGGTQPELPEPSLPSSSMTEPSMTAPEPATEHGSNVAVGAEASGGASPLVVNGFDAPGTIGPASAPADGGASPSPAAAEPPTSLSPVLALSGVVDVGSLPAPAPGVSLEAALRESRWALRAGGTVLFERHVGVEDAVGAPGAELSLVVGNLAACGVPLGSYRSSSAVFVCAGWELGRLTARGTGVSAPRAGHQLWSAPRLDAGLSVAVPETAFRLSLQLTAAAPLKQDDFFLRDLGNVHQVPWAVGRFSLGADVAF
jgi:hypothetical protein